MAWTEQTTRRSASDLIVALFFDVWPPDVTCFDFGVSSEAHLGALQYACKHDEVTEEQLIAAFGNGPAIEKLISEDNPYFGIRFVTIWDPLTGPDDETEN